RDFQALLSPKAFNPTSVEGSYVIAATDYAQQVVLPSLIAILRVQSPNLKVIVRDFELDKLNDLMENGKVNLAIAFPDYIPESYPMIKLFEEHHVCITSKHSTISKVNPS
ncbi:LysR substrate-binding domain-containing protein, partial [Vibrio anguillarum]